jgi:ribosomal protein S18 acetylase RimI-like enzyme
MAIDAPVPASDFAGPGNTIVSQVTDAAAFADFVHVSQLSFAEAGLPATVASSLFADPEAALRSADIFVARTDERVIAAALSITGTESRVGGIYWVGTVPDARQHGAGAAVTRAATNAAFARGAAVVTLQASSAGEPVYRRMGYREVTRYFRFLSPARA